MGTCVAVMLLPAALMGLAFPLVTHIATDTLGALGRRLSAVYAANTLGTVLGSAGAGFLLIPAVGVRATIAVGVALNLLVGLAYLVGFGRARPSVAGLGLACAAAAVLGWVLLPDWNKHILTSGAYIYPGYYLRGDAVATMEEKEILHYRDALTGTISVTRVSLPVCPEPVISLQINGKTDASTMDLSTQLMLAHLPALLQPEPRTALVVGLASGCTVGALGLHPEVRHIDCVEIEPEMARVTDFFRHVNHDCLKDPRVSLVFDDARNFVRVTPRRYDLITSEPSNPWISGVANLFTREYFAQCRACLSPGGMFCQWIPVYNLAPWDLQCVMATFQEVFPNCSLWLFPALPSDAYLVGTLGSEAVDVTRLTRRARRPAIAADLKASGLRDVWDILAGRVLGAEAIAAASRGAPLNTDDLPVLEFTSPLVLHTTIPRSTMLQVIGVAQHTQTPLSVCGEQVGKAYRSDLTGLRLGPPFSRPTRELLDVRRDPRGLTGAPDGGWAHVAAHLVCGLGPAQADIYAWRADLPSGEDVPDVPQREPDSVLSVSGHETGLWQTLDGTRVVGWVARWSCPSQGRAYMIVARADGAGRLSAAKEALAHTGCCGGGPATGLQDQEVQDK